MNKTFLFLFPFFFMALLSCHQEQIIPVEIDFSLQTMDENFTSPLNVAVINRTKNADAYHWTFEGGNPATSDKKNPDAVVFSSPGDHTVTLEAWNSGDRNVKSSVIRVDSAVSLNFRVDVEINNYAPALFHIHNQSSGGSVYRWIFEGGSPAVYEGFSPPPVTYFQKGAYSVVLIANNGSSDFVLSQSIEVRESLDASFEIIPSFEDIDDMEAPLQATLETRLQGVETLLWKCKNAEITNKTSPDAGLFFSQAGNYAVYLNVSNGKHEKRISREITIKPNTNLRTHNNIRFGINTAQGTVGSLYSTRLRRSFKNTEVNETNGAFIDIAFLGLNANFLYNRFVSPDNLFDTPLTPVQGAAATLFVNVQERTDNVQLTVEQFNAMTTDSYLKKLDLTLANPENDFFSEYPLPRVVLFKTADGRNGAILVKEAVKNGRENSYILTDIKIQKNE